MDAESLNQLQLLVFGVMLSSRAAVGLQRHVTVLQTAAGADSASPSPLSSAYLMSVPLDPIDLSSMRCPRCQHPALYTTSDCWVCCLLMCDCEDSLLISVNRDAFGRLIDHQDMKALSFEGTGLFYGNISSP
jgi:hypothetical protein